MQLKPSPLEQSSFCEAHGVRPGHDDMVEHPDTHKRKRVLELPRQRFVGTGRLSDTRGVIMGETILNTDGTPHVEVPEPLPPGSRMIEIVITDPPNRPPFEPTVKPQV